VPITQTVRGETVLIKGNDEGDMRQNDLVDNTTKLDDRLS